MAIPLFPLGSIGLLLIVAAIMAMLTRRVGLPYSTGLVAAGILISFMPNRPQLPLTRELQQIVVVQAAMPTAMLPIILARLHGADSALALGIVITTTAISLLTIPAWLHFGAWWVGI